MAYFLKRYHPPGTAPGTLQAPRPDLGAPLRLFLIDYAGSDFTEVELATPEACRQYLERDSVTWIHVQGDAEPDTMRQLGQMFGLHDLALEDVINTGQRPKVDEYANQLFVVLAHPLLEDGPAGISTAQISLFAGPGFVVSFHPGAADPFGPVRQRLRDPAGRFRRRGADYLFYALIDLAVDEGFPILEALGDEIEELEEDLLRRPTREALHRIHRLKRSLLTVRRMLWPQREVLTRLVRDETGVVSDENRVYFRDSYDHTIQIMDLLETYRDMVTGLLDIYLSSVSYRLNEIMRVLTIIATIFIPLTFIVGVYGMNFANADSPWAMPELRWYYGYPLVWILMICVVGAMLFLFRRRHWL